MKKTLLMLLMPAVLAGAGLLSAAPAYCDLPPVIPVGHPRDAVPMLQVEPNRMQNGFWGNLFKKLPLPQKVLWGSVKPLDPTEVVKRLEPAIPPHGHHRGGSIWDEGGPGGTVTPPAGSRWRKGPIPPRQPGPDPFYGGAKPEEESSGQPDAAIPPVPLEGLGLPDSGSYEVEVGVGDTDVDVGPQFPPIEMVGMSLVGKGPPSGAADPLKIPVSPTGMSVGDYMRIRHLGP